MAQQTSNKKNRISNDDQSALAEIVKSYNFTLQGANSKTNKLHHHYLRQAKISYWLTIIFFSLFTLLSVSMLSIGIYTSFLLEMNTFMRLISVGAIIISFIFILLLLSNNPIKLTRKSLNDLIKINIIFTGYTRQIYQIDAEFKKSIVREDLNSTEIDSFTKRVQEAVEQTVDTLLMSSDEYIE